jgi:hypothetical protein
MSATLEIIDRSPRGVAARNGISIPTVFRELAAGRLKAKKIGRRTVITEQDEKAWIDALPAFRSRTAA